MMMKHIRGYKLAALFICIVLIALNCYFLFKKDSIVERVYYENNYELVEPATYTHILSKQGIIAPKERLLIAEHAANLSEVSVVTGQPIFMGDVIAYYNAQQQELIGEQFQGEIDAYNLELKGLNDALFEIEMMGDRFDPSSSISSRQFEESLSVTIQAEIMQEQSTSGAIALLKQHIAATERNLQIAQTALNVALTERALISPINGVIGAIKNDSGVLTFELLSEDKLILAYVSPEEWQIVQPEQTVELAIYNDERDDYLQGTVISKQALPVTDSTWYSYLKESVAIHSNEIVYEIQIAVNDLLLDQPLATFSDNQITLNVFEQATIAPKHWVSGNIETDIGKIRTLRYNGFVQAQEIFIYDTIDANNVVSLPSEINTINEDTSELIEATNESSVEPVIMREETALTAIDPTLDRLKKRLEKAQQEIVVFENFGEQKTIILPPRKGSSYRRAIAPMRFETFSFDRTGRVDWNDAVKYLFY